MINPKEWRQRRQDKFPADVWADALQVIKQQFKPEHLPLWQEALQDIDDEVRIAPDTWLAKVQRHAPTSREDYGGSKQLHGFLPQLHPAISLARSVRLAFDQGFTGKKLEQWRNYPELPAITSLYIKLYESAGEQLAIVLSKLPELRHLHVEAVNLNEPIGFQALINAPCVVSDCLRSLHLSRTGLDASGLRTILQSFADGGLTSLILSHEPLGPAGMQVLAEWSGFSRLTSLHLERTKMQPEGAKTLAQINQPLQLRKLLLDDGGWDAGDIGREGAIALAGAPWLGQLESLTIRYNSIRKEGFMALLQRQDLLALQELEIFCSGLNDECVEFLATQAQLPSLRHLRLHKNGLTRTGKHKIRQNPGLANLETVRL